MLHPTIAPFAVDDARSMAVNMIDPIVAFSLIAGLLVFLLATV